MNNLGTLARNPVLTASALKSPAAGAVVAAGLRSEATPARPDSTAGKARQNLIISTSQLTSWPPQSHWARMGLQRLWTRRYSFATPQYDSAFGGQDFHARPFAYMRAGRQ